MRGARRAGFTLFEVLTVIAILILLAGVLFPVLAQAREAARQATCLSNLRQLALAHQMYVGDYDEVLPAWYVRGPRGLVIWTELLRPYYRDTRLLDQGFSRQTVGSGSTWFADYAMCAWGAGGKGTREEPYWRWPGARWEGPPSRPMLLAEVRRTGETLQFADGVTRYNRSVYDNIIQRRHRNEVLNGAFLDGRAGPITDAAWRRIGRDEHGYFHAIAAADR